MWYFHLLFLSITRRGIIVFVNNMVSSLRRDPDEWNGIIITADNAQKNKLATRYLICETNSRERLLIVTSPCWAHILSNRTKRSLGPFPFGPSYGCVM